jgi:hypothetical protein
VHPPHSQGWADFSIMMECTPESGLCESSVNNIIEKKFILYFVFGHLNHVQIGSDYGPGPVSKAGFISGSGPESNYRGPYDQDPVQIFSCRIQICMDHMDQMVLATGRAQALIVPDWGDKVNHGIGLPASLHI